MLYRTWGSAQLCSFCLDVMFEIHIQFHHFVLHSINLEVTNEITDTCNVISDWLTIVGFLHIGM